MKRLEYLKAFNGPFKRPRLKWYFGKVAIGTPYFLPRRWVKPTHEMAMEAAMEEIARAEDWNKRNPNSEFRHRVRPLDEVYAEKLEWKFPAPKKIGFDFVGLGWKTKWTPTDYRFEWAPVVSFVFFGWQIAVVVQAPAQDQYWEAWLYYHRNTKGTRRERVKQCRKEYSLTYATGTNENETFIDYYDLILKDKYK